MKHTLPLLCCLALACACGTASNQPVSPSPMDEEVNVGYGTMSRKDLGFAVDKLAVDETVVSSYTNIAEYLRGRVAGVEVNANGTIQIRGKNSINSPTEAMVLVDGVECTDINSINPQDIKSVEVLKDGSAAIYGSLGANGVILITTKGGFEQKMEQEEARKAALEAEKAARKAQKEARKAAKEAKKNAR